MEVIRPLQIQDKNIFPEAIRLLNRTQGKDLFAPDFLDLLILNPNAFIVGAFLDAKITGLGVAQIISDFSYYLPFNSNIAAELAKEKVGSFSTLAIHESHQGKGIGQKIARLRLEWLKNNKCTTVLGVSWVSGLKHTSNRVFEKMGFTAIKKIEHFYKEMSTKKPFYCPGCKVAPCTCSAILYQLKL